MPESGRGAGWRTSSRCDSNACVEVRRGEGVVEVRGTTAPGTRLTFDDASWRELLGDLRTGTHVR